MSSRIIAAFRDGAQCHREAGAVQWSISGVDKDCAMPLEILLSGAASIELPARFGSAELHVRDELGTPVYELHGDGRVYALQVRAVQVHRDAAAAFARVLPDVRISLGARLGWWLLLNALRVPGVSGLLRRFRGPSGNQ